MHPALQSALNFPISFHSFRPRNENDRLRAKNEIPKDVDTHWRARLFGVRV